MFNLSNLSIVPNKIDNNTNTAQNIPNTHKVDDNDGNNNYHFMGREMFTQKSINNPHPSPLQQDQLPDMNNTKVYNFILMYRGKCGMKLPS